MALAICKAILPEFVCVKSQSVPKQQRTMTIEAGPQSNPLLCKDTLRITLRNGRLDVVVVGSIKGSEQNPAKLGPMDKESLSSSILEAESGK